jgi:hypothetical protein
VLRVGPWDFVTRLSSALHGDTAALVAVANEVRIPIRDSDNSVYLLSAVDFAEEIRRPLADFISDPFELVDSGVLAWDGNAVTIAA